MTPEQWASLIGGGFTPVVVLYLLITGKLRTGREAEFLEDELATARADLKAISEKSVESIIRSTLAMERVIPLLEQRSKRES